MNPIVTEILGSFIRFALAGAAGILVANGVWTEAQATTFVPAIITGVLTLGWSVWQKYKSRLKLVTALATPGVNTEADIKEKIVEGGTPSTATPTDQIPRPTK